MHEAATDELMMVAKGMLVVIELASLRFRFLGRRLPFLPTPDGRPCNAVAV